MADVSFKHETETSDNSENVSPADNKEDKKQKPQNKEKEDVVGNEGGGLADSKLLSNDESDEEEKTVTDESSGNEDNAAEGEDGDALKDKLSEEQSPQSREEGATKTKIAKNKKKRDKDREKEKEKKKSKGEKDIEKAKKKKLSDGERKKKDSPEKGTTANKHQKKVKNKKKADETGDYEFTLEPVVSSESLSHEEDKFKKEKRKGGSPEKQPRKHQDGKEKEGKTGKDEKKKEEEDNKEEQSKEKGDQQTKQQSSRRQADSSGGNAGPGECDLNEVVSTDGATTRESMLEDKANITENFTGPRIPNFHKEDGGEKHQIEIWDDECENDEQSQNKPGTYSEASQQQIPNVTENSQEPNTLNVHNNEGIHKEHQIGASTEIQKKECENGDQYKSGPLKEISGASREPGFPQVENNADGSFKSFASKLLDKTKSMLGFPTDKERKFYFYVRVPMPARAVYLQTCDKFSGRLGPSYQMDSIDEGRSLYWRIRVFGCFQQNQMFYYHVQYDPNQWYDNSANRRSMNYLRSDFSVFQQMNTDVTASLFWFARYVYFLMINGELSHVEALKEYDLIRFGYPGCFLEERRSVANWIDNELAESGTNIQNIIFLAHVIQRFDQKLLSKNKSNRPVLKDLIKSDTSTTLLNVIRQHSKDDLTLIPNLVDLVSGLLCNMKSGISLEMFVSYVFHLGTDLINKLSNYEFHWSEEEIISFFERKEVCSILKDPDREKIRNRVLGFIVNWKRVPTVSAIWKLHEILHKVCPSYVNSSGLFTKTCSQLLFPKETCSHAVLDKTSWPSIPERLKSEFVQPYFKGLSENLKHLNELNVEERDAVKVFFTDEIVLASGKMKEGFLEICKFPSMSKIIVDILRDSIFKAVCWDVASDEFKKQLYHKVLAFSPQRQRQESNHVLKVFHRLDQVLFALDACHLDGVKETAIKKCHNDTGAEELKTIAGAYEHIEELHPEVRKQYYDCLQRSIEKEVKEESTIVELLKSLNVEDKKQRSKVERITKETMRCLCQDLKIPSETKEIEKQGFEKNFQDVLNKRSLWTALLDTWPSWQEFEDFPQLALLMKELHRLKHALKEGNIRVRDLKRLGSKQDGVDVLQKMHSVFLGHSNENDEEQSVSGLLSSCLQKESDSFQKLKKLLEAGRFVKRKTENIVNITDIDDILNDIASKKRSYEDTILSEVLDDDYWSTAQPFLDRLKGLENLMQFQVFRNAAMSCLREVCEDLVCPSDEEESEWVLTTLIEGGSSRLTELCEPLFNDVGSMTIFNANTLLQGVSEPNVESEMDFIRLRTDNQEFDGHTKEFLLRFVNFDNMHENLKSLTDLLSLLNLFHEEVLLKHLTYQIDEKEDYEDLQELYDATEKVIDVEKSLRGPKGEVVKELAESPDLVKLLQETVHDDVRNLIDAVEEHSDTTVAAKEVSDFIDIHMFLSPVFQDKKEFTKVLTDRLNSISEKEANSIAAKIKDSSHNAHSLRNVYKHIANRGEMTKEIVDAALKKGEFKIFTSKEDESWKYSLTYIEDQEDVISHKVNMERLQKDIIRHNVNMERLQDIKSRALLIVNSEKNQLGSSEDVVDYQEFINQIDLLNDIVITGEDLQHSGHPRFQDFWCKCSSLKEIQATHQELRDDLLTWEGTVEVARNTNFYLNFFHPKHLWTLKKLFTDTHNASVKNEALSLLRFVDGDVTMEFVTEFDNNLKIDDGSDYDMQFSQIGMCLEKFFGSSSKQIQEMTDIDVKRGLSVAVLDNNNTRTAAVVMALYKDLPLYPNKILFCHENSTWDEIMLFLRRCFSVQSNNVPYCLANVESLDTDLQFQLVDAIRNLQVKGSQYWLVLICRGGDQHHIINQFRECALKKITELSNSEMKQVFSSKFPDVFMITSDLPGLGKTELIHEEAAKKRKELVCFPINGPVERHKLVHRLLNLGLDEDSFLHIDISEVDDPLLVDSFLFELIVLGMVSSSTKLFHLPTSSIAIEVANTLEHHLRDTLTITKCFRRNHVNWVDFRNFICSEENESAIQVVCQYLHAYEKKSLETETLSSKDLKVGKPLSESECRRLLKKYSPINWGDLSFNTVEIFLNVLAAQLRRFSSSPFFRPEFLKDTIKETGDIRVQLFEALKDVSIEFAKRSVESCKKVQTFALLQNILNSRKETASKMVDRVEGMVQWAEENHLVVMFQEAGSISALFRELKKVPEQVQELFESQNARLRDLQDLSEDELIEKLRKILIVDGKSPVKDDSESYVLTSDNILKMVLIVQRIRARVPVIVMGETGCGKTSLVRYLAKSCNVQLAVMNFHAGIYEDDIIKFTREQIKNAEEDVEKQMWIFFDEINTCDHLGLINDIICHRCLNGKELPPNIVFIAACNPYCLRSSDCITTAGLSGKSLTDEYSNLVYRVKPLPETMMDYVWDYGSLDPKDERAYIKRMVNKLNTSDPELVVDLLATSQEFIRHHQSRYSVSLRDVRRCILLAEWFMRIIKKRSRIGVSKLRKLSEKVRGIYVDAQNHDLEDRSIVLALAHSYQSRIASSSKRKEFQTELAQVYRRHQTDITEQDFDNIVRAEQEEYLARMELPDGTARNTALRENVFVMLVCILNRIPVFVVGKPGCSKSLSMQVIVSNLRGKDSKDDFFKMLPQLLVVSYQGSESSTSEGILKVFDKAQKYREQNKEDESLPVVLLDEVGLAEISKYNPLKVLHRLLEPEEKERPDVAVVGISNWALDAAKMNRAIHLSRPEPTRQDLEETGQSILEAQLATSNVLREDSLQELDENMLSCLAESYHGYQKDQVHQNFHGLRDYYSLIKCLSQTLMNKDAGTSVRFQAASTFRSFQRNFGGLSIKDKKIEDIFVENVRSLQHHQELDIKQDFAVTDLITDNLKDQSARHLMLITSGESTLGIIDETLSGMGKEKVVINGSKFEEDQSEDYSYRTLSRIILHMERECVLVLRDLESVYGSLYDMLNQNYIVVGQKKNCRVALGPYSNPMCQVHDGFRCIVLVDEKNVDYTDPPFLNRFEKQLLRYSDVLLDHELKVISLLKKWVQDFSCIEDNVFNERDVFLGLKDDTLASLVLLTRQNGSTGDLLQRCKKTLLDIATPDGVLRSLRSKQYKNDPQEVKTLYENYFFKKPLHNGLKGFIEFFFGEDSQEEQSTTANFSLKYFVMTHSSIHTDVAKCLEESFRCQVERLGAFKSERQLSKTIQQFWQDSTDKDLLVFQCQPNLDAEHMVLMKSTIEQCHENYLMRCTNEGKTPRKSVCIIVHLQRGESSNTWQFNFLHNWKQGVVDAVEEPEVQVSKVLGQKVVSLIEEETLSLEQIIANKLMWCFTRLKYPQYSPADQESVHNQVTDLKSNKLMMEYLKKIVLRWITSHHEIQEDKCLSANLQACDWQVKVACNKNALLGSSTLSGALLRYIDNLVRQPLAKAIFLIEDRLSFECCQRVLKRSRGNSDGILADLITDENLFNIDDIPDPHEPHCYVLTQTDLISSLNFPFSLIFNGKVDSLRDRYLSKFKNLEEEEQSHHLILDLQDDIRNCIPQLFGNDWLNNNLARYIEDVFDFASAKYSSEVSRGQRLQIMKAACADHLKSLPDCDDECVLAQIYFFLWQQESNFLAILQLFSCCKSIVDKDLNNLTRSYIHALKGALPDIISPNRLEAPIDGERGVDVEDWDADELRDYTDGGSDGDESSDGNENDDDDLNDNSGDSDDDTEDHDDTEDDSDDTEDEDSDDSSTDDDENADDDQGEDQHKINKTDSISDRNEDDDSMHNPKGPDIQKEQVEEEEEVEEGNIIAALKIPFFEHFLNALCESLLPKKELILKLGGPKSWQKMANTFISLVAKSELEETSLYIYLRICSDFTNMVLDTHHLQNPNSLYMLSELCYRGERLGDPQNCFHELFDVIDNMENLGIEAERFKISFLSRCLAGCETEEFFQEIVATVSSFTDKETLQMASPLVFEIIRQTFFSLHCESFEVSYSSLLEDYAGNETLQVLDEALNDAAAKANGVTDCHFVTVCLDAINKLMPDVDVLSDPADVSNSNSEIIICLRTSVAIVKEPRGKQSIFRLLTAVSYLRSFLASLAEMIHDTPSVLRTESKYSNLLEYLNSIFEVPMEGSTNFPRRSSTLLYFLKELKGYFSMYELRNLCEEASQLSFLTSLPWTELSMTPCHVFKVTDMKTQVKKALYLLMKSNDSSHVKDICSKLSSNAKLRMAFVAALMEDLYLPPIHIESMDKAADIIAQLLPRGLSDPYKRFILFLTGKEDFKKLRDSHGHSVSCTKPTVIVLHLLAILTAQISPQQIVDRPFFSYLLKPLKAAEGSCVLANPDNFNQEPTKLSRVSTCFCGTAFVRSDEQKACPQHRKFCSTSPVDSRTPRKVSRKELSMCIAETAEDEFFVSDMTPSSFRILHLLVHSALYAGVLLEVSTEDELAKVLCIDATGSPVEHCFKEVTNDLLVLQRLWGCNEDEMYSTVHQLIEDLSSLITKPLGGPSLTERSRKQWQKEFSEIVEFLQRQSDKAIPKVHPTSLESRIEEKDSTDKFSVDERNNWLPRLFRSTKEATFDDLCSKFHTSTHSKKNRHPLVALFLKYFKTLPKDPHVYQLMNFSNMLEQRFGRRLSRSKAKKYIEDVIKEDSDHYEELKEALDKFCLSWEFVRPDVKRELGEDVPHLSETSPTSYFLVDPDSDGRFLQAAIQVLQRMQNDFQDEVLHIAMEGSCRTLDFLKKSDTSCTMPLVHVQDVVEDEIICFEWDDQILCHSHNNTDYGRGKEIFYDFEKIERELAGRFLMKKVYLGTPGGLRCFPYSNELFRTCSNVLNDVGQRIRQVPIDANMQNRLSVMKDKSLGCVQDLLEHLEVIICWLAKTTHLDSDMLLLDYVERKLPKSNLLPPKLFQDPKREFKVCHVVSMYQTLEEIFSVFTSKNVSDKYRSVLSNDVKEWLQKATDELGADKVDELTVVLTALRRFIFRYLLSDQDDHSSRDPHEDVVNQLDDPSLWPLTMTSYSDDVNEEESTPVFKRLISEFVPRVMRAGEVYSVMTFYDDFVKAREKKKELAKKAPRKKTRPKLAANLSRFA